MITLTQYSLRSRFFTKVLFGFATVVLVPLILDFALPTSLRNMVHARTPLAPPAGTGQGHKDYAMGAGLMPLARPLVFENNGHVKGSKSRWLLQESPDGTQIYLAQGQPESRLAVIRDGMGGIKSFTSYKLSGSLPSKVSDPSTSSSAEDSATIFFENGRLSAFTTCLTEDKSDSFGRTCVTATQKLCRSLKETQTIEADTLKEVETYETRSLSLILTLRGTDHQLDNVVRSGNRLGVTSALQTTRGILSTSHSNTKPNIHLKDGLLNKARIKQHLDRHLPRLRNACRKTGLSESPLNSL